MSEPDDDNRIRVIDDNIGDYSKPQLFFRLAIAYADSSRILFAAMIDDSSRRTFAHAQAAHFLFEHALELFFKGALLKKTGQYDNTHHLDQLQSRYRKEYPKKLFALSGRIEETVKHDPQAPKSEYPRYPVDQNGNVWTGYNAYSIDVWKQEIDHLRSDLARLVALIDPLPPPAF